MSRSNESGNVTTRFLTIANEQTGPFKFQLGGSCPELTLAYETYGTLAPDRHNAVLVFHAFSGSAHAAGLNTALPEAGDLWTGECHLGWWDNFIGPGKAIDTNVFFVICANYIGGCYGSTGPRSINPETGKPYGSAFPMVTISDIADSQLRLVDHFEIETLHAVIGPSSGGMLSLNLATRYPERVRNLLPMSSGMNVTTLQRLSNLEQILAIEEDPHFNGGDYYGGALPRQGLALARMIAHKSYISLQTLESRARGEIMQRDDDALRCYALTSPVESYMLHQGAKFVRRFDANTFLRVAAAWQNYDLLRDAGAANARDLFKRCKHQRALVFSIDTDVCFYPEEQMELVAAMRSGGMQVQHITAHSDKGHDSFLLEPNLFAPHVDYLLKERYY